MISLWKESIARLSDATVLLALWQLLRCDGVVAEHLQPDSVLARQPGSSVDCLRCLLQFLLHLVQINQRAPDFLGKGCILLKEVCAFSPHSFEQWTKDIEVAPEPLASCAKNPNPIFQRPAAFTVNLPKLGLIPCDDDADRRTTLLRIP